MDGISSDNKKESLINILSVDEALTAARARSLFFLLISEIWLNGTILQ